MAMPNAEDRAARVDEVLACYLEAAEGGQLPSREELFRIHPDLAGELAAFFANHDVVARWTEPLRATVSGSPSLLGQTVGDYELLEEIAHGGMGIVYKARQCRLKRIVALKMLRSGRQATAGERQRFRSEIEAVALLDHPHIVPIYEVGEYNDQPYFSMKLLDGGSLSQHVDRFLRNPHTTAGLVATIAAAVHNAHQRGILHRDLKPGNILLDSKDQPYVSDFGLAKRLTRLETGTAGNGELTQSGAIVGTPAYMAPEQAFGQKGTVTTAADVYSIGAILYELLTGRPPFREATLLQTLRSLTEREPQRPRALNPRVDRDLETICLKCLAKDPQKRYGSAQALADDLRRYLAGESIQARSVSSQERFWRWCRRKPVIAGLVAALLLSIVLGFALVGWQWQRAMAHARQAEDNYDEAERQRVRAEQESARAEAMLRQAHQAVSELGAPFSEQELAPYPELQATRKRLLQIALKYYQTFLREHPDDPTLRRELADTHAGIALITDAIGSKTDTLAAYEQALRLYQELHKAQSTDRSLEAKLALLHLNLGTAQNATGKSAAAVASWQEARRLYQQLTQGDPKDTQLQRGLSLALVSLGSRARATGQLTEALAYYQEAQTVQEKRPDSPVVESSVLNTLAVTYANIGAIQLDQGGRLMEALTALQSAQAVRAKLVRHFPNVPRFRQDLAQDYREVGQVYEKLGKKPEAQAAFEQSRVLREKLAQDFPDQPRDRSDQAHSFTRQAIVLSADRKFPEALAAHQQALAIRQKLARENSNEVGCQQAVAESYYNIGVVQNALGNQAEAILAYQQSQALQEKLVRADPENIDYHSSLRTTLNNLGVVVAQRGGLEEGIEMLRQAIDHQRRAIERAPQSSKYHFALHCHYGSLGEIYRVAGRLAEAVNVTLARQKLWPGNGPELYRVAKDLALIAVKVVKVKAGSSAAEQAERRQYAQWTLHALREAVAGGLADPGQIEREPVFGFLRSQSGYAELLQEIKAKEPVAKP